MNYQPHLNQDFKQGKKNWKKTMVMNLKTLIIIKVETILKLAKELEME